MEQWDLTIKWIFAVWNNSVFTWKVFDINIISYDGAWKYGEESEERAPALSLQMWILLHSLIYALDNRCDFVQKKKAL